MHSVLRPNLEFGGNFSPQKLLSENCWHLKMFVPIFNSYLSTDRYEFCKSTFSDSVCSQWFSQSVIQCVYKVEVSRLQFTIGLGVGWTRWEWTVHVNTLYTVYTLNTMYTLYRGSHMYRCTELHICTEYVEVLKQALNAIAAFGAIFILNFIKTIPPPHTLPACADTGTNCISA